MDNSKQKFSLEQIELEMLKRAQEIWQTKNRPLDAFDPLVKMLIGACAVEVKKIFDEVQSSRSRVMERLAQVIMPEVLAGPIPASCIMQIQPVEPLLEITPELQAGYTRDGIDIFISPAGYYQVIDARVERSLLLLSDSLIDITEQAVPTKRTAQAKFIDLINREDFEISNERALLIGLDINEKISDLNGVSFFFDWMNVPHHQREEYCKLLHAARWKLNGNPIETVPGIFSPKTSQQQSYLQQLKKEFDISGMLENQINACYRRHFVTLHLSNQEKKLAHIKQPCPDSIKHLFDSQNYPFSKPLVWLEVYFPGAFPNIALAEQLTHCLINCIPVMNRKINVKRHLPFDQNLNVIPLETDDQFLTMETVSDNSGNMYENVQNIFESPQNTGTYHLRRGGVGRLDSRGARELLLQLIDAVRDESLAFSAMYPDELVADLNTLKKILARIDQKLSQSESNSESPCYIVLSPKRKNGGMYEEIIVKFWTTTGALGNDIPPGEINKITSINYAPAIKEITNVTLTVSGRDKLKEADLLNTFRRQILTRGRIVTAEDLQSVCFAYLGSHLSNVEIKKGFSIDGSPGNGFMKTLEIVLEPSTSCRFTAGEWKQICQDLKTSLETQWNGNLPLHIHVKDSEN